MGYSSIELVKNNDICILKNKTIKIVKNKDEINGLKQVWITNNALTFEDPKWRESKIEIKPKLTNIWNKIFKEIPIIKVLPINIAKYNTGNYIRIYIVPHQNKWDTVLKEDNSWIKGITYKLIHKDHKEILEVALNNGKIELLNNISFQNSEEWIKTDFLNKYNESYNYRIAENQDDDDVELYY